jgi:hypothetical protein
METKGSLLHSQKPATGPYPEPYESSPQSHTHFKIYSLLSYPLCLDKTKIIIIPRMKIRRCGSASSCSKPWRFIDSVQDVALITFLYPTILDSITDKFLSMFLCFSDPFHTNWCLSRQRNVLLSISLVNSQTLNCIAKYALYKADVWSKDFCEQLDPVIGKRPKKRC